MRIAGAQINLCVGDLDGNEQKIADCMDWAESEGADVLLLPELAITGYPPEDLVLRLPFVEDNLDVVRRLAARSGECVTVVGFVDQGQGAGSGANDAGERRVFNAAAVLQRGTWQATYHKILLPNYGVFDEDRYFLVGTQPAFTTDLAGIRTGISICEDIWLADGPPIQQARAGARILLNINGSPYHYGKAREREQMLAERARIAGVPVVYVNLVGGQDELVFDGCSVAINADGTVVHRSPQFVEDRFLLDFDGERLGPGRLHALVGVEEEIYGALRLGLGDYVRKNGFSRVVVGLSGGIDSSLTAAIATDALGAEGVWGIAMPTRFSSDHSLADAIDLSKRLGIQFDQVSIQPVFDAHLAALEPLFGDGPFGVAEENLQARIRGAVLMAISNRFGPMVVATGNKSEMAVGYSTIYGDMVGGFAVLKDVFKTTVYDLAKWRNQQGEVIPQSSITKPPSAELRPNQKDSDSLPPYEALDPVLTLYIEGDRGPEEIIAAGHDAETVRRITRLVDASEYKRRQAAPGVKITTKAFGRDRRLPITNGYR
jgi:NAD+ synthase (glutamine-hydrolysing)